MNSHRKNKGFTLIELIITMVVGSIIVGGVMALIYSSKEDGYSDNAAYSDNTAYIELEDGMVYRPLVQLPEKGKWGGVAAGMAYKWGVDPWLPRLGFIVFTVTGGAGILIYLIMLVALDEAPTPDDYDNRIAGAQ